MASQRRTGAFCDRVLAGDFWTHFEAQKPVRIPEALPNAVDLVGVDDLFAALAQGTATGATAAYKKGVPHARDNPFLSYLDGATMNLNDAENFFPELLELCQALGASFDFVSARLVLHPPACFGPPLIPDAELIAVQLWGKQQIRACRSVQGLPVTAPRPEPLLSATLQPGDAVFIPSGLECHVAPTEGAEQNPMLYAILTIRSKEQSVEVSLAKYLNDLLMEGKFSPEVDGFMRSALSRHSLPERPFKAAGAADPDPDSRKEGVALPSSTPRVELEALLAKGASEFAALIGGEGLHAHFAKRMEQRREAQRQDAEKTLQTMGEEADARGKVVTGSQVQLPRGVTCRCTPGDTKALFQRGGDVLNLPIEASASTLIHAISDGGPHTVSSLPCEDPFERICVCQILVFKECLEIVKAKAQQR